MMQFSFQFSDRRPSRTIMILGRADKALATLAALATILAIIFAVQQFYISEAEGRVAATLSYVARFNSEPVVSSFQKIYLAWQDTAENPLPDGDLLSQQRFFVHKYKLEWSVTQVGDFFDQLYVCVLRKICDKELAIRMLKRDILTAYVTSHSYLAAEVAPTGCGLSALAAIVPPASAYRPQKPGGRNRTPKLPKLAGNACPEV